MTEGILIAFEGIDGAGKTTQANRLAEILEGAGETVLLTKEPTNGEYGRILRESASTARLAVDEELDLFEKDRRDHIEREIGPALSRGEVVILDRYFYSTVAYQGIRTGDPISIEDRNREFAIVPDMTFLLDVEAAVGMFRVNGRANGVSTFEKVDDLTAARSIFLDLAGRDQEVVVLDGACAIETLHKTIVEMLLDGPIKSKRCYKDYDCDGYMCGFRMNRMCAWAELNASLRGMLPEQQYAAVRASAG